MDILICGGRRLLGKAITRALYARGHRVCVLNRSGVTPGRSGEIEALAADRDDQEHLAHVLGRRHFDAVIDNSAYRGDQVHKLLTVLGDRAKRYILMSTYWVENPGWQGNIGPSRRDVYIAGKEACEAVVRTTAVQPWVIVRPCAVLGPDDHTLRSYFYVQRLLDGGDLLVPEVGGLRFPLLYVEDLARGMASIAEGSGGQGVTYSVMPPGDISLAEYLKFTAEALKAKTHSYWAPIEEIQEGFPEYLDVEPFHTECNAHVGSDWCQDINVSFSPYEGWVGEVATWYRDHYRGPNSWGYQERPREVVHARSKGRLSRDGGERLSFAVTACEAAGAMLKRARSLHAIQPDEHGQQLKSPFDRASGEILSLLIEEVYPEDALICEDLVPRLTQRRSSTAEGEPSIWIVDPLDGTRSYHGGFSGYCVQMAHSRQGQLLIGVVHVPEENSTYWAVAGFGSFRRSGRRIDQIVTRELPGLGTRVFTDSRPPGRTERKWFDELGAPRFLECGSYGVKLCRIAEGQADFLIKRVGCEIWDVAAGALILVEAGGWLTGWNFTRPDFCCRQTSLEGLVAMGSDSAEIRELVRRQVFVLPQMELTS